MLRLYPTPAASIPDKDTYSSLKSEFESAAQGRALPYVVMNMVTSMDGSTTISGKASAIGSPTDRLVMNTLRAQVDAVMVGANTIKAEKYSIKTPVGDTRVGETTVQPWLVIQTRTGEIPTANLIGSTADKTILLVPDKTSLVRNEVADHVLSAPDTGSPGDIDPRKALTALKSTFGINTLLVEGGPTLNGRLMKYRLVDEVLLTISPKILGGAPHEAKTLLASSPLRPPTEASLLSIHTTHDELFLRYSINANASGFR